MDPVTAIGLASAILSFVDVGNRVIARIKEFASASEEVPKEYKFISEQLPVLVDSLEKIRKDSKKNHNSLNEGLARALVPVVKGLEAQIALLGNIFESTTPNKTDSSWERSLKAIKSLRRDADVAKIYSRICGYRDTITHYQVTKFNDLAPVIIEAAFKPTYSVPDHRRVAVFFGREDVLTELEQKLDVPGTKPSIVVLYGMAGQGKTQIALSFCQRAHFPDRTGNRRYYAVFWVDASSREAACKSFTEIYDDIKTPQQALTKEEDQIKFVKATLQQWTVPWLIVFDNFDSPAKFSDAREFMPSGLHGAILITSTHGDSRGFCSTAQGIVNVEGIETEDAIKLLVTRSQQEETKENFERAKEIVEELGNHPLALAQAAEYVSQLPPLSGFLKRYFAHKSAVLEWTPELWEHKKRTGTGDDYHNISVFANFELLLTNLQRVGSYHNMIEKFLDICGFFHNEYLFEGLFETAPDSHDWRELFKNADGTWNSDNFVRVVTALAKMSLIQDFSPEKKSFSLHRLMSEWLKWRSRRLDPNQDLKTHVRLAAWILKGYLESTMKTADIEFESIDYEMKGKLLLHVLACQKNIRDMWGSISDPVDSAEYEEIQESFAWFLVAMGEYGKASLIQTEVLSLRKKRLQPHEVLLFSSSTRLAKIYRLQGKFEEAENILLENMKNASNLMPQDPINVENTMTLVVTLSDQRKFDLAKKYAIDAVQLKEKHGFDRRSILSSQTMLAWVVQNQEQYKEAETMNEEIIKEKLKLFGERDLDTLTSYNAQGVVFHLTGRFKQAQEYAYKAAKGREEKLGRHHPDTLNALTNLAMILASQKEFQLSETLTREILKAREEGLCSAHVATLATVENLITILKKQNRLVEVTELQKHLNQGSNRTWAKFYGQAGGEKTVVDGKPPAVEVASSSLFQTPPKKRSLLHPFSSKDKKMEALQSAQQQQQ